MLGTHPFSSYPSFCMQLPLVTGMCHIPERLIHGYSNNNHYATSNGNFLKNVFISAFGKKDI